MFFSFSSCQRPPQPRAGRAARVIWLLMLWHSTAVLFCFIFFVMHAILSSLCYAFSARHFPPSRDCGLYHLSISCWFLPFRLAPRHAGGLRERFDVGSPYHSACVSFNRLSSQRWRSVGGFGGALPYHSACVFLQLLSLRLFSGFIA